MQAPDPSPPGPQTPVRGSIRQQQQQQGFRQEVLQQLQSGVSQGVLSGNNSRPRQMEQGNTFVYHLNESQPQAPIEQSVSMNMMRTGQQLQAHMQNMANSQLRAQLQARQVARLAAMQRPTIASTCGLHLPPRSWRPPVPSESSSRRNSLSDRPAQMGHVRRQQPILSGFQPSDGSTSSVLNSNNFHMQQQQFGGQSQENPNVIVPKHPFVHGNRGMSVRMPQYSTEVSYPNNMLIHPGTPQTGNLSSLQQNYHMSQAIVSPTVHPSIQVPSQGELVQRPQPLYGFGFTQQQFRTLKAQILAFKCLNRGVRELPDDVLQAIAPPPLHFQCPQLFFSPEKVCQDPICVRSSELRGRIADSSTNLFPIVKEEHLNIGKKVAFSGNIERCAALVNQPLTLGSIGQREQSKIIMVESQQEVEKKTQKLPIQSYHSPKQAKVVPTSAQIPVGNTIVGCRQPMRPISSQNLQAPKDAFTITHQSPHLEHSNLTDTRKLDSVGVTTTNHSHNLMLAYDANDLLSVEGINVFNKKRTENFNKISGLLAVESKRKRIKPDLVLCLKIEEKKLQLSGLQARLRTEVDQQQQEIMTMPDRLYERFTRQCERRRNDLLKQCQLANKAARKKHLKSIFHWRKKILEVHMGIRDARTICNRGVLKHHEKMLKEFLKRKDEDRTKRMEALKNNDVDIYREMLLEQQFDIPGDAAERYLVLSTFLSQTEEYLLKHGQKIMAAQFQGISIEDAMSSTACAGEEVMIRNSFSEMNSGMDDSSPNKYYNLAHSIKEGVVRQPSMLQAGTLRDYQIVGLQWMLSLYNNKLNGILADEMGLGKTVQVIALIAYLMEFKGNYGPHLIIVPNAVLLNWKSELRKWLPSVSCIFYIGTKDQRLSLFSQEVLALRFNVLVTSYEFVMHDRTKLSKIDWKYIIIDEAQRMKDRESVLARDLDKYRCQRRLLLTGTPLQNDLKELWSLLNLLLPEVFDNGKAFHDWFSKPFRKDTSSNSHNAEDDWLETEKKVIIIHRLHQILEPFMLRRRVEDVEGALPHKVSVVLRCSMSPLQSCIYDWIKSSGTIRVDPEDELRRVQKNPRYQVKKYKHLTNKCMELRKVCNHPLLTYPYFNDYSKEFIVRSCGKLWVLDRVLIKLQRAGHRVLLFSTMTKLLDILEEYLQWRQLIYRRIDGTSSLQDRESAIMDFNSPDSTCFIFLLSIRAAGRGLNLQTADTVIIYDPDPNPQNEVQAVARVHRIGQKREVKVIYMEAVADKIYSHQKEDDLMNGGTGVVLVKDDLSAKDRYVGSIESLIRDKIQQYKIDMADEVINAGRFDQRTTHEERRITLETLLHDEERYQESSVYDVPSLQEVNRMIARSEEEIKLFDQMDEEFDWSVEIMKYNHVPKWLRSGSQELNAVINHLSKKSSKNFLTSDVDFGSSELFHGLSPCDTARRGRRRNCRQTGNNCSIYKVSEYEDDEDFGASSDETESSSHEVVEIEDFEDMEFEVDGQPSNKDQQSGSWNHDLDDNEEGLIHQPTMKRKRSIRSRRPVCNVEKPEKCSNKSTVVTQHSSQMPILKVNHDYDFLSRSHPVTVKCYERGSAFKRKGNLPSIEVLNTALPQPEASGFLFRPADGSMQMKCKNVISNLQMRINKDGDQIIPILSDFWKKSESSSFVSQSMIGNNLDLQKIDQRLDFLGYVTISDFVADVQLVLKNAVQSCNYSNEVRNEAMKLNNIFFNLMKNSFPETDKWATSSSMAFFQPGVLSSPLQLHLRNLVTCKKKRKHRERPTAIKWIPLQQQQGAGGHNGNSFVTKDQGSRPAKRMRTGAGTKRATHRRRR